MNPKVFVRAVTKAFSALLTINKNSTSNVIFLMYHRITGDVNMELDIPFSDFSTQMQWLAKNADVISLDEAINLCENGVSDKGERLKVVITFDDAYKDFYTLAWPLLRDLNLPSTLYVPTGFIENPNSPPISSSFEGMEVLQPVNWEMLREISSDPRVTLAAHSHDHLEYSSLSTEAMIKDVEASHKLFEENLGFIPAHFAYPRGAWSPTCRNLLKKYYRSIVLVGGGGISFESFDCMSIPRVPVLRSDGELWFKYRVTGRLIYDELLADILKRRN